MFSSLEMAPPDAILGLTEAFSKDPNPDKINLGVGVYKDAQGTTPVLASVKEAQRRLLETETTKTYKPISGDPTYGRLVREMLFGTDHAALTQQRAVTAHCPGGTGALRVAADFLARQLGAPTVWLSSPTWANHNAIFRAAGIATQTYPYFDAASQDLAWGPMEAALSQIPEGDVVLLHGCCHNPTGVDPTGEQWSALADLLHQRKLLPLFDFAYQGFGGGLDADALGVRTLCDRLPEVIICSSYSKNFGLYNERTGAITVVAESQGVAEAVLSHVKVCIRSNYSNPPAHGGAIVTTILCDPALRSQWEQEVTAMRDRINGMRKLFVETLTAKKAKIDCSSIMRQRGMFSMSGLSKDHAKRLREQHSIYIVDSGRISVAGMTLANMEKLCDGIVAVTS